MGRKFSFFAWAVGKSSSKDADFRRLLILLGSLLVLVLVIVIARMVIWRDSTHEHEPGPHGGVIIAINEDEPHYHVEFVVEADGRIRLFLSGEKPEQIVQVKPHTLIAREIGGRTRRNVNPTSAFRNHERSSARHIPVLGPDVAGPDGKGTHTGSQGS